MSITAAGDPLESALTALRARITRVFPHQIRTAVAPLSDEQIWWRPNESSNSIANILIHVTGSLNHFLNRNLGGLEYVRNREAEFTERRPISKAELLASFDAMVENAERTFEVLTADRLSTASPEPSMHSLVIEDLINVAVHLSNHAGQIVWIAKMFEAPLDEVWMRAHRSGGAWKKR